MIKLGAALKVGAALFFTGMLAQSIAQGAELSGNFGSGDNDGNISASIGGGGMNSTGSATGPSGTTSSGSLSIGRGSSVQASSSTGTANNTNGNFTTSIGGGSGIIGGTNFTSGNTSLGLGLGQPGSPGGVPSAGPNAPGTDLAGIAAALGDLSTNERRRLANKCVSVLAAPNRHDPDTVIVCQVLASL